MDIWELTKLAKNKVTCHCHCHFVGLVIWDPGTHLHFLKEKKDTTLLIILESMAEASKLKSPIVANTIWALIFRP